MNNIDVSKKCRVIDSQGNVYSGIPDTSGFGKRKLMLELKPSNIGYIFPSKSSADSAISHTIEFMKRMGIETDKIYFYVEELPSEKT